MRATPPPPSSHFPPVFHRYLDNTEIDVADIVAAQLVGASEPVVGRFVVDALLCRASGSGSGGGGGSAGLTMVDLRGRNLAVLPPGRLQALPGLQHLLLGNNLLDDGALVAGGLGDLRGLRVLDVSDNLVRRGAAVAALACVACGGKRRAWCFGCA
jgi:hypothetical protein